MSLKRRLPFSIHLFIPDTRSHYIRTVNLLKHDYAPQDIYTKKLNKTWIEPFFEKSGSRSVNSRI